MSTVESYRPLLMTLAYRMLGSLSEAEDIVQDALADYVMTADCGSIKPKSLFGSNGHQQKLETEAIRA
ncbi:sigma factor [Paenibacillus glycanilyticus]|nr:sigma factor [Paenibacillus glycanilyticus]